MNGWLAPAPFPDGFGGDLVEGRFPGNLVLDDFDEGDIGDAEAGGVGDEWATHAAAAAVKLADPSRDEVHEDIGVAHFLEGSADQVGIHGGEIPWFFEGRPD